MKRISILLAGLMLCAAAPLRAQDAATEERLKQLSGRLDDLTDAKESLKNQIAALSREIANLREQAGKPSGNYASQEELKSLAEAVKEIDRKRLEDYGKIHAELERLIKIVSGGTKLPKSSPPVEANDTPVNPTQKVFPYVIQEDDTLSKIVAAYKEKNIKVTSEQILKANPGLKANKLKVGQKIYIPAPQ